MPLVTTKEMFEKAYKGKYAIGAFNVNNMEIIQGIVEAAKEARAPLILQVSSGARKYANANYLTKLVEAALLDAPELDIALHLDHGDTFELCKQCIDDGFTSVMIDGSHLPYEENVALTKQVVDYAHARGVSVEAELGRLAGVEDDINVAAEDATYTDPEQAKDFVTRTGCDSLAVAIGTSHGAYKFKGEPKLDIPRLKRIQELLPGFPIVLHGASSVIPEFVDMNNEYGGDIPGARGVPEELIREATKYGVCKVNIDSDLRLAMTGVIRRELSKDPGNFDPRKYLGPARSAIKEIVTHKIY
ncbi:MAG TPA: class II fructose-1,6-bisphosphate aldolase, partial [Clostridia bacterium]|nr:class II fructose-1,6-bisphosphate aldolase [Clostridia bacterium]